MTARLLKLFFLEVLFGGAGAVVGSFVGTAFGRGGLLVGAFVGGVATVVLAGYLACRLDCVNRNERFWVIGGGIAGFVIACMVALATISTPGGPLGATVLIGMGAVLGALLGRSPHGEP